MESEAERTRRNKAASVPPIRGLKWYLTLSAGTFGGEGWNKEGKTNSRTTLKNKEMRRRTRGGGRERDSDRSGLRAAKRCYRWYLTGLKEVAAETPTFPPSGEVSIAGDGI